MTVSLRVLRYPVDRRGTDRHTRALSSSAWRRAVALSLAPVLVTAGATAVSAVAAASAAAAGGAPVLVLLQNGETTAPETTVLQNIGYTVTQATPAAWQGMSAAQFEGYAALVIGDPSSGGSCSALTPTTGASGADAIGATWQQAVSGDLAVLGTAPALPGSAAANTLIGDSVKYAAARYSASSSGTAQSGTGLYVSLNCEYSTAAAGTGVPLLAGVEGIGAAGGLSVRGGLSCTDAGTVNRWESAAAGVFGGFTSSSLTGSAWSPGCPVQEAFTAWPALFTPLGYDAAGDATPNFTASNGGSGQPYLLLGASVSAATAALAPSTGGEVPAGATAGGTSNPAAPGIRQASAADPVNTENGDFTESATDLSIPTFGPDLKFNRSYDAQTAQQQTEAGAPGPMGYGWTDTWASSLATVKAQPGSIYGIDGLSTLNGDGGPGPQSTLGAPGETMADGSGNLYIADAADNRVQELAASSGTQWGIAMTAGDIYTVAGSATGIPGASGNGTAAAQALLDHPQGLAVSSAGLFIADTANCRVVEIPAASGTQWGIAMTAGELYVIAGQTGDCTTGTDNVLATHSDLDGPTSLHFGQGSQSGDLYIADAANNRIQEIAGLSEVEWGRSLTAGDVYTIAGSAAGTPGNSVNGTSAQLTLLTDPQGVTLIGNNMYIADTGNCRVAEIPGSTGTQWGIAMTANQVYDVAGRNGSGNCLLGNDAKVATQSDLNAPTSVRVPDGNMYIADAGNNRVQEVAGTTHTQFGQSMTAAFVYTIAGSSTAAGGDSGDGGPATQALLSGPSTLWFSNGNVIVADAGNDEVRQISASTSAISDVAGNGYSLATTGDGHAAVTAGLSAPRGIAADAGGDTFIADTGNNRVQEIAASGHTQFGVAMTPGDVYTVAGSARGAAGDSGNGGPATGALLNGPNGIAVDASGNLYIADEFNHQVRKVAAGTGVISTVAGSAAGTIGDSGDGGPATGALLGDPNSLAVDAAGDLFIGDFDNEQVQEVPANSGTQYGVAMTKGDIYTVAGTPGVEGDAGDGGPATSAELALPCGVAVDAAGDLYISDTGNNQVREVAASGHTQFGIAMAAADIYTVAGSVSGAAGNSGDGGPAAAALLDTPGQIAVDSAGDLYVADTSDNRVREIAAANGSQWSQSMTAGDVYDIAGSPAGAGGGSGDGGPATAALLRTMVGLGLDPAGDVFIADGGDNLVQEVAATAVTPIPAAPGQTSSLAPAPGGITVTEPDGGQVTFYGQSGGACAAPYQAAGAYCVRAAFDGSALTYNSLAQTYAFAAAPGDNTYTYSSTGRLAGVADRAGNTLTIMYQNPAPGSGRCPAAAASCETVTAASGRSLVIGANSSGLTTSVSDPLGRTWTYAYSGGRLTSATSPLGHATSYTYGPGSTGNSLLANALLTITGPNAQAGGPDASKATVNVYDSLGRVTSQTDPMGYKTTFSYCVNAAAGNCMNPATGTGYVTVTDPDANTTVYDYTQGALAAETHLTGGTVVSETDYNPITAAGTALGGTLLDAAATDGDGNTTTYGYDAVGDQTSATAPDPTGASGTTTGAYTGSAEPTCDGTDDADPAATCLQDAGPSPVAPGGAIAPPSTAPPLGLTYSLNDTLGNQLYTTTGVYQPGSSSASSLRTAYQLFNGNTLMLSGAAVNCAASAPSPSLPCATVNANGVVTQLAYDSAGDVVSSATPDGNGSEIATTSYAYDPDGEQTAATSPDGNLPGADAGDYTTVTAYDNDGRKTSETQGGGSGAIVTPRATFYGYDANDNQTSVKNARGFTTATTYNADDQATLTTDPAGNSSLTCYDGDGNTVQTVPPVGVAANGLTAASCPASYPAGYGTRLAADSTVTTFDALGERIRLTTPAPSGQSGYETTSFTYDANGQLVQTVAPPTVAGGPAQTTVDSYNSGGELVARTTGYGTSAASTTAYCYNSTGGLTSVVAPDGNSSGVAQCETASPWIVDSGAYPVQAAYQTTSSYDSAGELVATTAPATAAAPHGATTAYTYDPAGNTLTRTSPGAISTTSAYTPDGLVSSVSYSGSSAHSVAYSYDANGQRKTMTDATGASSYSYDPFGELSSTTNGANQTIGYGYSPDRKVTSITYPLPDAATWATSKSVSYQYDNADQLAAVTDFTGNTIGITDTHDGLASAETLGSTGDTVTTSYDNTDRPSLISLGNANSALRSYTYSDAPSGTVVNETDAPPAATSPATYGYDAQARIVSMTPGSGASSNYSFDASGNLTTLPGGASATYDNAGELTSASTSPNTTGYVYSADGERLSASQSGIAVATATWNGARQLVGYSGSAATMTAATYDGDALRASSTTTPTGGTSTTQSYTWDASAQVPDLLMDSANAYLYEGGGSPVEQVNLTTGVVAYLVTDSLGSVRSLVGGNGAVTASTVFDAWGNAETPGGLAAFTPFGFAGGYTDPTGMIYLINRYYDPATGQFTSLDPDVAQTRQPYEYAGGNPVGNVDPTGLFTQTMTASWGNKTVKVTAQTCFEFNLYAVKVSHCTSGDVVHNVPAGHMTAQIEYTNVGHTNEGVEGVHAWFTDKSGLALPFFRFVFCIPATGPRGCAVPYQFPFPWVEGNHVHTYNTGWQQLGFRDNPYITSRDAYAKATLWAVSTRTNRIYPVASAAAFLTPTGA